MSCMVHDAGETARVLGQFGISNTGKPSNDRCVPGSLEVSCTAGLFGLFPMRRNGTTDPKAVSPQSYALSKEK